MKLVSALFAWNVAVWAQSPHVRRFNNMESPEPRLEVRISRMSVGGVEVTKLVSNLSESHDDPYKILVKRPDTGDPSGRDQEGRRPPMFPMKSCYWCPPQEDLRGDAWNLLDKFTTDEFERRTRAMPADLRDTCMFYSKTVRSPPYALSKMATQLACKYKKYSIWHLWPNRVNEATTNLKMLNYYGLFDPTNRLYPISQAGPIAGTKKPGFIQYFENMSRAMANMCTGQIYLLSQTPENLKQYRDPPLAPNIWATTEYPALTNHLHNLAQTLIVINVSDPSSKPAAWTVNWRTLTMRDPADYRRGGTSAMEGWVPYDLDSELYQDRDQEMGTGLNRRDLCTDSGVDEEPFGDDWFG